ncbi:MAG TPA: HEPN domain-containing protein [Candidatus Binatia bacterium]|nr:HEPN domain-containing protein [Candidatus Binatia bacterium]
MPPRRKAPGTPREWLARAKSNLAMARREKTEEVFWEDLCFETQQAAEKALKAVLQSKAIRFRYVHSLEELITTLERHRIVVPENIKEAVVLTQYALETRYPGTFEAVSEEEYRRALDLAEQVVSWAEKVLSEKGAAEQ